MVLLSMRMVLLDGSIIPAVMNIEMLSGVSLYVQHKVYVTLNFE